MIVPARRARARMLHVPSASWSSADVWAGLFGSGAVDEVTRFEDEVSGVLGIDTLAVGSGRTALYLILRALGDSVRRVVVPAYTCVAVPNAIGTAGLPIEWVDVDGVNLDLRQVHRTVQPGDAVLLQHTYGVPIPGTAIDALRRMSSPPFLVEDRAHRFDAADMLGDAAFFSLEYSKVLSAGRGGLVWVRDPILRARVRAARDELAEQSHADARAYARTSAIQRLLAGAPSIGGFASLLRRATLRVPFLSTAAHSLDERDESRIEPTQMHPLSARLARSGLTRLPRDLDHRRRLSAIYEKVLGSRIPAEARHGNAVIRLPVLVHDAEAVRALMRERGVDLGVRWFDAPVHPKGSRSTYRAGQAPHAEELVNQVVNLPLHPLITAADAAGLGRMLDRIR